MTRSNRKVIYSPGVILGLLIVGTLWLGGCGKEDPPPPPPPECLEDSDCEAGMECRGGNCLEAKVRHECATNDDCASNRVCRLQGEVRKCVAECESADDCSGENVCWKDRCMSEEEARQKGMPPALGSSAPAEACEIQTIHFDFDEYYLTSEARQTLRDNYECIKSKGSVRVKIEGHCDERGSLEYNLALGQRRARAVRDFLVNLGISRNKIETISYGEERPLSYGHNEDAWAKNRRGETIIKD